MLEKEAGGSQNWQGVLHGKTQGERNEGERERWEEEDKVRKWIPRVRSLYLVN
jgi:hypothetical protein